MSGRAPPPSSGAAQPGEEGLVVAEDALDRCRLRGRVPHVTFVSAAKDDAVGPREHVPGAASDGVADLRLRLEDGELAADRLQLLIAEQVAAAEAGAVEDQGFGQGGEV